MKIRSHLFSFDDISKAIVIMPLSVTHFEQYEIIKKLQEVRNRVVHGFIANNLDMSSRQILELTAKLCKTGSAS